MARRNKAGRNSAICAYRNSGVNNKGEFWDPPMPATMARNERFKLTLYASAGQTERELFNLVSDPQEQHNIAGDPAHADIELSLLGEIAAYLQNEADTAPRRATSSIPGPAQRIRNSIK